MQEFSRHLQIFVRQFRKYQKLYSINFIVATIEYFLAGIRKSSGPGYFRLLSVSSVEKHRVQQLSLVLWLELLDDFFQFVVEILTIFHALRQLAQDEGADRRVLLVVDYIHVQHVHGLLLAWGSLLEDREHRIVALLFACYDHVEVLYDSRKFKFSRPL